MRLRVYGEPKGQPRTKACRSGAHASVYTPSTADAWKLAIIAAWRGMLLPEYVGPFPARLELDVLFSRPGRLKTRKASPDRIRHSGKPDADNLAKAVMDALTMCGAWVDDAQVCELVTRKWYAAADEHPGAVIVLEVAA